MSLFDRCRECGGPTERGIKRECGTAVEIMSKCKNRNCGFFYEWCNQPRHGQLFLFNILLSAAILVSGSCITKLLRALRFINIAVFSDRTFFYHQKWYLLPATSCIFAAQKEDNFQSEINASGDMRCDSPGHTAKYGTYTIINADSQKVMHIEVVQKDECPNSSSMELEGLKRALAVLRGHGVEIKRFVSDRHSSVAAYLRDTVKTIIHYFDVWHIAKGIRKQILKVSKQKDCGIIGRWTQSIINMVYWIACTTPETDNIDRDGELRKQKFQSIYNHVRGIHVHDTHLYPKCLHGELEPRDYISPSKYCQSLNTQMKCIS
ncbi:uncharacterized protein LOC117102235 [Anneissia japonica]|uniref:uncharacterized protein LOC117102235 n=1 Tax=Anneissia japonica TaxID=1529436 RepID=UPI0014258469|nr:uncharacterized protein LOC117102235 [Anneissia japonica]